MSSCRCFLRIEKLEDALRVLIETPALKKALEALDPMALEQAQRALAGSWYGYEGYEDSKKK